MAASVNMRTKYLPNGSYKNLIILFSVRESIVWSCITFLIILETNGRTKIGLEILGPLSVSFLYRGLSFANLQSFGK